MPLNVAGRQAPGLQRQDLLIKPFQAPLAFGHQQRLKAALAITGRLEGKIPVGRLHRFRCAPITGIAGAPALRGLWGIAQMLGEFCPQRTFHESLRQLFDEPMFAENVVG